MDHLLLLSLAALIVGASKGGLASAGALAVPLLTIWMDPLIAAGFLLPIFIVSDAVGVWLFRREFSRQNVMLLIPAGLLGVVLAALMAPWLSVTITTLLTGLIGLVFCLQQFVKHLKRDVRAVPFDPWRGTFWGAISGITSFISHTGAPPFQAFVMPQRLPKMHYAGTITIVFAVINLAKLPAYASVGLMDGLDWRVLGIMSVIAALGAVLGRWISQRLPDAVYMAVIQIILFVLSVYLVWKSLAALL